MKWLLLSLVCISWLHCAGSAPEAPKLPEPAAVAEELKIDPDLPISALHGKGKLVVVMVPLQVPEGESPAALVRFTGIDHELAGITFRANRFVSSPDAVTWRIRLDGNDNAGVLSVWITDPDITLMQFPGFEGDPRLRADKLLVDTVDPQVLLAEYKKALADGSLAELERFHREPQVTLRAQGLKNRQTQLEADCRAPIAVSMDWDAVPDEDIGTTSHCYGAVAALGLVCLRGEAGRRAVVSQIKELQCARGDTTSFTLGTDKVLRRSELRNMSDYNGASSARDLAYKSLVDLLKLTRTVLRSSDGLVVVFDPDDVSADMHIGRNGLLYTQYTVGLVSRNRSIWDGAKGAHFTEIAPGKWEAKCSTQTKEFLEVDDKFRVALLASAKIKPRVWKRASLALARDDRGIYYFVDRFDEANGGKGFRVFKGPRGALKLTKLIDIVDDSDGMIFATTKGKLRLVINTKSDMQARWIEGKKERALTNLALGENREFIYGDLGVYAEDRYGSICDL
jgi:hypothetical protein